MILFAISPDLSHDKVVEPESARNARRCHVIVRNIEGVQRLNLWFAPVSLPIGSRSSHTGPDRPLMASQSVRLVLDGLSNSVL